MAKARPKPPTGVLDWTDRTHWDHRGPKPCRYCAGPTQLRDSDRKPAHKTCAERALSEQAEDATVIYLRTRRT
ncbi:hypothetical protein JHN59_11530 [Streptomyces sp. MBT49]|uniref:hypothetical protein n=1 Tax=unclassified Streptomyces TaxID=2593676 RepID=UPI001909BA1F|nr:MULTISPECIES: hypothetical protein [unclassified Streptomyces]MBK3625466.1 hypothetical protein [Streptomyces sp. MBT49]MBK3633271.1 hypothetical protein [Streptomyces sp. MBT97]